MPDFEIQFDEAAHIYTVAGIRRYSVTQIMGAVGLIDDQWFTEESRKRGTKVHVAAHYADENDLDPAWRLTSPYVKYLEAWERFKQDAKFTPRLIEQRVFHPTLGYCGTIDRTGEYDSTSDTIIDLKTGQHESWHQIQLASYAACMKDPAKYRRVNVYLRNDGTYRIREYKNSEYRRDFAVFQAAITLFNFKYPKGVPDVGHGPNTSDSPVSAAA